MSKLRQLAFEMNAGDKPAKLLLQFEVVEIGCATTVARINGQSMVSRVMQRQAVVLKRRDDRNFLRREIDGELVLLEDRGIAPAARAIELGDDGRTILDTDLVDAILVAVQRMNAAITSEAGALDTFDYGIRKEIRVWSITPGNTISARIVGRHFIWNRAHLPACSTA